MRATPLSAKGGTAQSESGSLRRALLKRPASAFRETARRRVDWKELGYAADPDRAVAAEEHERLERTLRDAGVELLFLPDDDADTMDAVYVRDASIPTDRGLILCRMGKPARAPEPGTQGRYLAACGVPLLGRIEAPGTLEGGDAAWLDGKTLAVGRSYRTNDEGIRQLRALLGDAVDAVTVDLPHWRGPDDVFHLMSILSPLAPDVALVDAPLLPVPFRRFLLDRGIRLVEVPEEERDSMGANALALSPRRCILWEGNPRTRARIEDAGIEVIPLPGTEIGRKGGGGPTCLVRPLWRGIS